MSLMEADCPRGPDNPPVFGKLNVGRDGERGQAVVLKAERHGGVSGAGGVSTVTYDLELRAHFDDGSSVDFSQHVGNAFKGAGAGFSVGDVVPTRFDPKNHERIELDMRAIRAQVEDDQRQAAANEADRAERIAARLAEGKLPPMRGSEALKAGMELEARLASGTITQEQFEAERDAIRARQSLY
jgi:hypothetical protein